MAEYLGYSSDDIQNAFSFIKIKIDAICKRCSDSVLAEFIENRLIIDICNMPPTEMVEMAKRMGFELEVL